MKTLFGRKVAVDASMSIYQFLIAVRQKDGEMLTNDAGETTRCVNANASLYSLYLVLKLCIVRLMRFSFDWMLQLSCYIACLLSFAPSPNPMMW